MRGREFGSEIAQGLSQSCPHKDTDRHGNIGQVSGRSALHPSPGPTIGSDCRADSGVRWTL